MNKKLFQKVVLIALAVAVLIALVAPAIFGQTGQPRQEKLLNGLKVLMWPDTTSDKVSVRLRIHSGSAFDPQGKEGVMQMLADNLFPNEAAREYFTDDLGGSLDITSNYDYIEISASSKASEYLSMLETIASVIANTPFDKETTAKLKTAQLQRIASSEADPAYVADHAVAKRLFGTFPYGRPHLGTTESVNKIDYADLVDAKSRFLTADNATLAMSGNFPRAQARTAVSRYFGAWLKADKKVPATFRQPDEPPSAILAVNSPKGGMPVARFAIRGTARGGKDSAAAMIFTVILQSRLGDDALVRNEMHVLPGMISAEIQPKPNDSGSVARQIFIKALSDPITEVEFGAARSVVLARWSQRDDRISFWLDHDTYATANIETDVRAAESLSFSDINIYAAKARKQPVAAILLHTPLKAS